ncbi:hypothetical protein V3N99_08625 [Dermatophilaceae bacterium Soc4.6]
MDSKVRERRMRLRKHSDAPPAVGPAEAGDARALALELAGLQAERPVDPMTLGVVLEPGEVLWRLSMSWLRVRIDGLWSDASWSQVLITDRRLLVRLASSDLVSLWWGSMVGFEVDLRAGHVVLDFGDGRPRLLSGPAVAVVAVAGVAQLYGIPALVTHPSLAPLRT